MIRRHCLNAGLVIAVTLAGFAEVSAEPFETVLNNGSPLNRVDIAVLGDGYTAAQLAQYRNNVSQFIQQVFGQEPYREYQRYFNVHRIDVTSNQSGADHPENVPPLFVDTALDAAYNCTGIERLICVNNVKVNQVVNASLPANHYDIILVIVNDAEYGGSGGSIAVASIHPGAFAELVLHEVGHSFGLLADEYAGGGPACNPNVEPPEPNATRVTNRPLIKWNIWIDPGTPIPTTTTTPAIPGLYEGAKYCNSGLYRPTFNDKMRNLGMPFEQITREQHVKRVYQFVNPIDVSSPAGLMVAMTTTQTQAFSITPLVPFTHTLNVSWTVDGQAAGTGAALNLNGATLTVGQHALQAVVTDPTTMVRNDPGQLLWATRNWTVNVTAGQRRPPFDYDADGKTDVSVFRPTTGAWYLQRSTAGFQGLQFGVDGDKLTPADYDGDGKTDIAVYRPSSGTWFILKSATGTVDYPVFGVVEDLPAPADYDGDGKADLTVFRPSQGTWYRQNSSNGSFFGFQFGANGDVPTVGDFDGDGKNDIGIWRPSNGDWYNIRSSNGSVFGERFGQTGDKIAPADYDGDGKTDIAIFRPSTGLWVVRNSATATYSYEVFGLPADVPISGDYDGDGKADIGVWRPSDGTWYIKRSDNSQFIVFPWGQNGDKPTPSAYGN